MAFFHWQTIVYFCCPETRGRTLEEVDLIFLQGNLRNSDAAKILEADTPGTGSSTDVSGDSMEKAERGVSSEINPTNAEETTAPTETAAIHTKEWVVTTEHSVLHLQEFWATVSFCSDVEYTTKAKVSLIVVIKIQ